MRRAASIAALACGFLCLAMLWGQPRASLGQVPAPAREQTKAPVALKPQTRVQGQAIPVDPATISIDDGDSVFIHWPDGDEETVRILGIDSPEVRHDEHGIPLDQSFGPEARAFAQGAFAVATDVKLIRAGMLDPYGRTLGYLIVNGKNYSVLIVRARLAEESVSHYGDNGLPALAAEVTAAAKAAGPMPFEPPYVFRKRMRILSETAKSARREPRP
jgi:micrococcal nuclease